MLSSLEIVRSSAAELVHQRGISDRHRELDAARVTARSDLQPWQVERAVVHVAAAEHHPGAMTAHRRKEVCAMSPAQSLIWSQLRQSPACVLAIAAAGNP